VCCRQSGTNRHSVSIRANRQCAFSKPISPEMSAREAESQDYPGGSGSSPIRSFTALRNRCLHPRYRPVVCTETCPNRNWILFQLTTRLMTETGTGPRQVMGCESRNLTYLCSLLAQAVTDGLAVTQKSEIRQSSRLPEALLAPDRSQVGSALPASCWSPNPMKGLTCSISSRLWK
jgi:hypothetical protein